ncbi:MAG: ribose 5-phosphate isomerase B [Bdellovibrionales bacterium GWB1_55_8]|nr:MAG: ribose 5-phosphate isomerase B [Bdellovibrionales bacterium GWB1_55_8]
MKKNAETILIASDHAGIALKAAIQKALSDWEWKDLGPVNGDRVDYPDFAEKLGASIASGVAKRGILICGSGIGMSIAANKIAGIRAAVVENPVAARLSREHNDANVLCLGSRFIAPEYGAEIAQAWLTTEFSADHRHEGRIKKIARLEKK